MSDAPKEPQVIMSRTAAAKVEARHEAQAAEKAEGAAKTAVHTPASYDVKKMAEVSAAEFGHQLGPWKTAVAGVANFWNSACVHCGVSYSARWMPPPSDGKDPYPSFGSPDNAGRRACTGNAAVGAKEVTRFSAVPE